MDLEKAQAEKAPSPEGLAPDTIVSPDTRRANTFRRVNRGRANGRCWMPAGRRKSTWRSGASGWAACVGRKAEWNWEEFQALPRVKVFADFHCVTRWSRLGNLWEGVSTRELLERAGGAAAEARFALAHGYDRGWTTNLPLENFLAADALVAVLHDGAPIPVEHGGPARLIVPQLYAWKSAKWIAGVELLKDDRPGFWEANGYHMRGDPWAEERYGF